MREFRSDNRSNGFGGDRNRSRFRNSNFSGRGGKFGGNGGFKDRDSRSFERHPEMHEVTCDKCGKQCKVPFKPTGDKSVFCSDCFRNGGNSGSKGNFDSRGRNDSQSAMSSEQFKQINEKLDKIIKFLSEIEFEEDSEEDFDEVESDEDDNEDSDSQ